MTDIRCVICGAKGTSGGAKITNQDNRVARTFNLVWKHLQQKRVDGERGKSLEETLLSGGKDGGDLGMPSLCNGCLRKVLGIEQLIKVLRVKVGELEELLKRNGGDGEVKGLEEEVLEENGLDEHEATDVEFVHVEWMGMEAGDPENDDEEKEQGESNKEDKVKEDQDDDDDKDWVYNSKSESESVSDEDDEEAEVIELDEDVSMQEVDPLADVGTTVKKPVIPLTRSPKGENFYASVASLWKHQVSEQSGLHAPKRKPRPKKINRSKQECNLCGEKIPFQSILEHVQGHVGIYAQQCPNPRCPFVFGNDSGLMNHLKRRSQKCKPKNYQYTCDVCQLTTPSRLTFKAHLKNAHERDSNKSYPCPVQDCQERFGAQKSIPFHLDAHRFLEGGLPQKLEWKCEVEGCGQVFGNKEAFNGHKRLKHPEKVLPCPECGKGFPTRSLLTTHEISKHGKGSFPYACEKCGKCFRSPKKLAKHTKAIHDHTKPFECDICKHGFWELDRLRIHKRNYHSDKKNN